MAQVAMPGGPVTNALQGVKLLGFVAETVHSHGVSADRMGGYAWSVRSVGRR